MRLLVVLGVVLGVLGVLRVLVLVLAVKAVLAVLRALGAFGCWDHPHPNGPCAEGDQRPLLLLCMELDRGVQCAPWRRCGLVDVELVRLRGLARLGGLLGLPLRAPIPHLGLNNLKKKIYIFNNNKGVILFK